MRIELINLILQKVKKEKDFDEYRKYYDSFTFVELKYINNEITKIFKNIPQKDYNFSIFTEIFSTAYNVVERPLKIIELGPNRGYLAKETIDLYDKYVEWWRGYDLYPFSSSDLVIQSDKYTPIELMDYFYNTELPDFDFFISTHTFEHLNKEQVEKHVYHIRNCSSVLLEIPRIDMLESSWDTYAGTHVLNMKINDLHEIFDNVNFKLFFYKLYFMQWAIIGYIKKDLV